MSRNNAWMIALVSLSLVAAPAWADGPKPRPKPADTTFHPQPKPAKPADTVPGAKVPLPGQEAALPRPADVLRRPPEGPILPPFLRELLRFWVNRYLAANPGGQHAVSVDSMARTIESYGRGNPRYAALLNRALGGGGGGARCADGWSKREMETEPDTLPWRFLRWVVEGLRGTCLDHSREDCPRCK